VVAGGASNKEAAAALFLSPKTIDFHLANVYSKLGLHRRTQLAALAAQRGWLEDRQPLDGIADDTDRAATQRARGN